MSAFGKLKFLSTLDKMDDIKLCEQLNMKKLTIEDILRVEKYCFAQFEAERVYDLRNQAKVRAVLSTKSYDEFKDIVEAATLFPIDKNDKRNSETKKRLWNSASSK